MNTAYSDMLIDVHDWRIERRAENVRFYADAIARGQVRVIPGKEKTTRRSNCDCCMKKQEPGILKFFYSNVTSFYFHACDGCWSEIVSADVHVPTVARIPQIVTS